MKNKYVEKNRSIIKAFNDKALEFKKQKDFNSRTYANDIVLRENQKVKEQESIAFQNALAEISKDFQTVKSRLTKANVFASHEVPSELLNIFNRNSVINLSKAEVQAYIDEYRGNYSVMRLIGDWIAENDKVTEENGNTLRSRYAGLKVPTPSEELEAYQQFYNSAVNMIYNIYSNGAYPYVQPDDYNNGNHYTDPNTPRQTEVQEPLEIRAYADEVLAKELYQAVGDGSHLDEYTYKDIPEGLKHTFDDVRIGYSSPTSFVSI